jgi:hypothetical protein
LQNLLTGCSMCYQNQRGFWVSFCVFTKHLWSQRWFSLTQLCLVSWIWPGQLGKYHILASVIPEGIVLRIFKNLLINLCFFAFCLLFFKPQAVRNKKNDHFTFAFLDPFFLV